MPIDFNQIETPCYVIDEQLLRNNLAIIKKVKEAAGVEILLAFKSFSTWGVFPIFKEYGFGASASSLNEARLAFEELGVKTHIYAPAYQQREMADILRYCSHISCNSLVELQRYREMAQREGISLGLRVNPEFSDTAYDIYNPCKPGSRFGITAEELGDALPAGVEGLHFHTLFEADSFALEQVLAVFMTKFGRFLPRVQWVNMGGGHLMTGKNYNIDHLISLLADFKGRFAVNIILEPGSAFTYQTGYLVATILDIVEHQGIKTAILDVSFTCHMPDCLEMPYKPTIQGAVDEKQGRPTYRMGGICCLAGDYMGNWSFERELHVGDKIIFEDMIHYTTVKTTMFNGVNHPSIGLWNEQSGFKVVKEFTYHDYKNRLS
ncbi:MAG: carboxynorspermidine decarboxylase [Deltaproteobacteria bacterium RBG_16_54_18]|nr:MAG: carboxynorspermidine decarboxylase [Deltaproteobacteria bacterium RBG_13_52_11]OGP92697.1 MAG: carboxynorspermidine decarboxylase [Deltaproteobacteria bacterium RBG_16_54_18]